MNNYPPGVTGNEWQIAGFERDTITVDGQDEEHHIDCDRYQSWMAMQEPYPDPDTDHVYDCNLNCAEAHQPPETDKENRTMKRPNLPPGAQTFKFPAQRRYAIRYAGQHIGDVWAFDEWRINSRGQKVWDTYWTGTGIEGTEHITRRAAIAKLIRNQDTKGN